MSIKRILTTDWMHPKALAPFSADEVEFIMPEKGEQFTEEKLMSLLPDCDGVLCVGKPFSKQHFDVAKKIKVVGVFGSGYNSIDWECAKERGAYIVNAPQSVAEPVAEFTVGLLLASTRGIVAYDQDVRKRRIACDTPTFFERDMLVAGTTLGLLGIGRIGRLVAQKCVGIGMNVLYYDPIRLSEADEAALGVRYGSMDEVVRECDVLTIHMHAAEDNRNMINRETFAKMKDHSYLINVSRSSIVNTADLIEAIKSGKLGGAAIDVYDNEPDIPAELTELPNVVLTPHCAAGVFKARVSVAHEVIGGMMEVLRGKVPVNAVNQDVIR